MSGVACVVDRGGAPIDSRSVDAILRRQAHRGPDGLRVWCDGEVGLGHAAHHPNRSPGIDEPLVADGGRLAVAGDLRITNPRELIEELDLAADTAADAAIVLEAYRRWGVEAAGRLEGGFAFVIWDSDRHRIFCARDHLGVKPLTYHLSDGLFVCASEAEAVTAHPGIGRVVNEARIADFLVSELEGADHTSTFFEGVERLAPAHLLVVDRGGQRLQRYWEPEGGPDLRLESDEAYAEAFAHTLRDAVGSCLTGVAAPGLLLSGGVDSGAVAATASRLADDGAAAPPTAFSFIDEEGDTSSETTNILGTIARLGAEARTLSPVSLGGLSKRDRRALLACGEPFDSGMVAANLLYSTAAASGTKVLLDGVDGDIVASTTCPTSWLLRRGSFLRAWREAVAGRRVAPGAAHPVRVLLGGGLRAWLPGGLRRWVGRCRDRRIRASDALEGSLIDREFARRVGLGDRLEELWSHDRPGPAEVPGARHRRAVAHPYVAVALERYDRVAARHGIEARHPFFDLRLVKLCLSLPWDLKVRNGWGKFVLRSAMAGEVPDEIRWRRDHGHVLWRPVSAAISQERAYLGSMLRGHDPLLGPFVDRAKLDRVRRAVDGTPTIDEEVWIWEAATLSRWLAEHLP
jgi:asparagine synthase (glutamine-hydrolysing)